jgi:RNA polymerase sigma-70 factor (ECF subfamily)
VAGLLALLRDDAVLTMPPKPTVIGARPIVDFLAASIFTIAPMRLFETHANGSPAFAAYFQAPIGRLSLFALLVIASDSHRITHLHAFADPRVLARFDLAAELAG